MWIFPLFAFEATITVKKKKSSSFSLNWVICLKGFLVCCKRIHTTYAAAAADRDFLFFCYASYWGLNGGDRRFRSSCLFCTQIALEVFLSTFSLHNFFTFVFCELLLASYCLFVVISLLSLPSTLSVSTHKSRLSFSLNFCFDFQFEIFADVFSCHHHFILF